MQVQMFLQEWANRRFSEDPTTVLCSSNTSAGIWAASSWWIGEDMTKCPITHLPSKRVGEHTLQEQPIKLNLELQGTKVQERWTQVFVGHRVWRSALPLCLACFECQGGLKQQGSVKLDLLVALTLFVAAHQRLGWRYLG